MSDRIRLLEDALAILQSTVSGPGGEPHPLLHRDLLVIKSSIELHSATQGGGGPGEDGIDPDEGVEPNEEQYMDAFGTLAIHDDGAATFYGRSAGSEVSLSYIMTVPKINHYSFPTVPAHCKHFTLLNPLSFFICTFLGRTSCLYFSIFASRIILANLSSFRPITQFIYNPNILQRVQLITRTPPTPPASFHRRRTSPIFHNISSNFFPPCAFSSSARNVIPNPLRNPTNYPSYINHTLPPHLLRSTTFNQDVSRTSSLVLWCCHSETD